MNEVKVEKVNGTPPFLCMGTFLSLLFHFGNKGKIDDGRIVTFTEPQVFADLIETVTGESYQNKSLPTLTSRYKGCKKNLPRCVLEDQSSALQYRDLIQEEYEIVSERMNVFVHDHINANKKETFVKALIELISMDESIAPSQHFYINGSELPVTKKQMANMSEFCLPALLVGIMRFLLLHRQGMNELGIDTLDYWGEQNPSSPRDLSKFPFGETVTWPVRVYVPEIKRRHDSENDEASTMETTEGDEPFNRFLSSCRCFNAQLTTAIAKTPAKFEDIFVNRYLAPEYWSELPDSPYLEDATIDSIAEQSQLSILVGSGGEGKSMMMTGLFYQAASKYMETGVLPVLLELQKYRLDDESLLDFIVRAMQEYSPKITKDAVINRLNSNQIFLMLDGLDEMAHDAVTSFEESMDKFARRYPGTPIIMSSRDCRNIHHFPRFAVWNFRPLDLAQSKELISKITYYDPNTQRRFLKELESHLYDEYKEFASNPLLLLIMLATFKERGSIPRELHELFASAFHAMLNDQDASKRLPFKRVLYTSLEDPAFIDCVADFCASTYDSNYREIPLSIALKHAEGVLERNKVNTGAKPIDFVYDLVESCSLMHFEGDFLHFAHNSFQEYFTALFLSDKMAGNYDILQAFFDEDHPGWKSDATLKMLYGMCGNDLDIYLFLPFFEKLLDHYGDDDDGYWHFMEQMYPNIEIEVFPSKEKMQEAPDVYEVMLDNLSDGVRPESYVYDFFMREHGLSHVDEVEELDWPMELVEAFSGKVFYWGKDHSGRTRSIYEHDYGLEYLQCEPEDIVGWEYTLESGIIDSIESEPMAALKARMEHFRFPLRQEYDALVSWVCNTRESLKPEANTISHLDQLRRRAS